MSHRNIPDDLKALLPKQASPLEDDRPLYQLWCFDPQTSEVHMDHNQDKEPAHHVLHRDIGGHIHHPDKVQGYAYSIKNGWRITNDEHKEVQDPFIVNRVMAKLRGEHPEPALPHVSYHRLADSLPTDSSGN
jgi:hypothetical protein